MDSWLGVPVVESWLRGPRRRAPSLTNKVVSNALLGDVRGYRD